MWKTANPISGTAAVTERAREDAREQRYVDLHERTDGIRARSLAAADAKLEPLTRQVKADFKLRAENILYDASDKIQTREAMNAKADADMVCGLAVRDPQGVALRPRFERRSRRSESAAAASAGPEDGDEPARGSGTFEQRAATRPRSLCRAARACRAGRRAFTLTQPPLRPSPWRGTSARARCKRGRRPPRRSGP